MADFCGGFREIKLYLLSEFCSCVLFLALICSVRSSYLMWQVFYCCLFFLSDLLKLKAILGQFICCWVRYLYYSYCSPQKIKKKVWFSFFFDEGLLFYS